MLNDGRDLACRLLQPQLDHASPPSLSSESGGGVPAKKKLTAETSAIRDYVMGTDGRAQGESTVLLHVSHSNLKQTFFQELRLDMHMTIERVKHKLEFHTGTSTMSNQLFLLDDTGKIISECEDGRKLGYYSPYDGCRLHIVDNDPNSASAGGWLEDTSLVKKYEISEEAYAARENTYRAFKAKKQAEDPEWSYKKDLEARAAGGKAHVAGGGGAAKAAEADEEFQAEAAAQMKIGDRCEAAGGRRGQVMFVGKVPGLPAGWWAGVRFDEPFGKGNGCAGGVRYFECEDKYGGFLRPELVTVGDFPEEDPFADEI